MGWDFSKTEVVKVNVHTIVVPDDFSKTEVVKVYVHTIVTPTMDYWKQTIEDKKGGQVERMKTVYFQPDVCLGQQDVGV